MFREENRFFQETPFFFFFLKRVVIEPSLVQKNIYRDLFGGKYVAKKERLFLESECEPRYFLERSVVKRFFGANISNIGPPCFW